MKKGEQKGKVKVLKHLYCPLWKPPAVTRLEQADTAQIEAWSERIFDAQTLEELLRWESDREQRS